MSIVLEPELAGVLLVLLLLLLLLLLELLPHAASTAIELTTAHPVINFPRDLIILLCSSPDLGCSGRGNLMRADDGDKQNEPI
jgi:hypothetical protein